MNTPEKMPTAQQWRRCQTEGCRTLVFKAFPHCARHSQSERDDARRLRSAESGQRVRPNEEKAQ
jgi:hypothetical protein